MILQIFRPPGEGEEFERCKLGDINDVVSLDFEQYFCGVGTFSAEIPITSPFADTIQPNRLIWCRDYSVCWIIKNVQRNIQRIKITGYDLNGLLRDRLALPSGEAEVSDGHELVAGTTEFCVKHFVAANLIGAELAERNYPRLSCADDLGRGSQNDSYYASPECVEDIVRTMCAGAGLGYRISLNTQQSTDKPVFVFDVQERVDRTADQSDNPRVIFSEGFRNITEMNREVGITAEKNAVWCETGGAPVFVNKTDETVPASWNRREEYVSISVIDSSDGEEVAASARQVMADKFAQTDSLEIDAGNPLEFGVLYNLGDIVTVYDKRSRARLDTWISGVAVSFGEGKHTVKLMLGESKPKLLDGYVKQTELMKKYQRDYPAAKDDPSADSSLTSYKMLSDTEVSCNGITYTAEYDSGSGLISKISDSAGAAIVPEITGEITDTALHNALFWAVAMSRGIEGSEEPTGIYAEYIPGGIDITQKLWHDSVGAHDIVLSGSPASDSGGLKLSGDSTYGKVEINEPCTIYAVFKGTKGRGDWTPIVGKATTASTSYASYDIFIDKNSYIMGSSNGGNRHSSVSAGDWHIVCITRSETGAPNLYIDGTLIGSFVANYGSIYGGSYYINNTYRGSLFGWAGTFTFRYLAFGSLEHSASQVIQMTQKLMKYVN